MWRILQRRPFTRQCRASLPHASARQGRRGREPVMATSRHVFCQRRTFVEVPAVLLPPVVFGGLVIALWSWKCFMMVIFQNKIIYMPGLPPNARRETIADYKKECSGIEWREEHIKSADGTRISLCVASVSSGMEALMNTVHILYFQGNASSLPPRLPFLSPVLQMLRDRAAEASLPIRYTMVCCSYRGYWTSRGRPSENGILMDAAAALKWIKADHHHQNSTEAGDAPVVIWGQSIGAGVATSLAAQLELFSQNLSLKLLILETPFLSIRAMLETLYPQKWLPYRHLWPFLWNHLDSWEALRTMKENYKQMDIQTPDILILEAGKDELVPKEHGDALERRCREFGLEVKKKVVGNALHTEVMVRPEGRNAVVENVEKVVQDLFAAPSASDHVHRGNR